MFRDEEDNCAISFSPVWVIYSRLWQFLDRSWAAEEQEAVINSVISDH